MTLVDLEGLSGRVSAHYVRSKASTVAHMRAGIVAVSTAGENGAINVWRSRDGKLRAVFYRHLVALSEVTLPTLADLHRWLDKWWPSLTSYEDA